MVTPRPDKGRNDRHHPDDEQAFSAVTVTLHNSSPGRSGYSVQ